MAMLFMNGVSYITNDDDAYENRVWSDVKKKYTGGVYGDTWLFSCTQMEFGSFLNDRAFSGIRKDDKDVLKYIVGVQKTEEYKYSGFFENDYDLFLTKCHVTSGI